MWMYNSDYRNLEEQAMPTTTTLRTAEEVSRLGHELFDRIVKPTLTPADARKYVIIDVNSGDFECDADGHTAAMRLLSRQPEGDLWLIRADGKLPRIRNSR
jgi:hypothetical protein